MRATIKAAEKAAEAAAALRARAAVEEELAASVEEVSLKRCQQLGQQLVDALRQADLGKISSDPATKPSPRTIEAEVERMQQIRSQVSHTRSLATKIADALEQSMSPPPLRT